MIHLENKSNWVLENSRADDKHALFQNVILLDLKRILSQLQSQHAKRTYKTAGKPAVITQPNQVLDDMSLRTVTRFTKGNLRNLKEKAQSLQSLFVQLESIPNVSANPAKASELLGPVIRTAYELTLGTDFKSALQTCSGNPSLKRHLSEAIGKGWSVLFRLLQPYLCRERHSIADVSEYSGRACTDKASPERKFTPEGACGNTIALLLRASSRASATKNHLFKQKCLLPMQPLC